jgi:hypothetical protein
MYILVNRLLTCVIIRKYKRYKTDAVKNELAAAEKQYKRTLDISMSRHRKDSIKEHLI